MNLDKWKVIGLASIVSLLLAVGTLTIGRTAISELAGLAVAQSSSQWNNVADASKGDGLGSGVVAGGPYLFNGLTFDRLRSVSASDGASATGLLANVSMVFNGTTYDRMRGGLTADAQAVTGILSTGPFGFNGTTYDRIRASLAADGQAATGLLSSQGFVFNSSTWDRVRTASADALAITGIQAAGLVGWNGASNDRLRTASATNNTAVTSLGALQVAPLGTWSVTNTPSVATQATASKAAGGGTVRNVATSITYCVATGATAQTPLIINLRDGATGAGTIIRSWAIAAVAGDSKCGDLSGLNMSGSANTAMTLETAAAPVANAQATVTLTGYSTP